MLKFKCDAPGCNKSITVPRGEDPTPLGNKHRNIVFVKKYSPDGKEAKELEYFGVCPECSKRYDQITRKLFDLETWEEEKGLKMPTSINLKPVKK
tara:strand:- start:1749 stop:2033 length:285 start_codon:yes stop_codon:yes gene_type:complete